MKKILVSFFLLGVAWATLNCECGKRNAGRIVGGKETKKNEYPWMVAFQRVGDNFTYCGGTVVSTWHVATAAHCVRHPKDDIFLVAGVHDGFDLTDIARQNLIIDEIIMHPSYDRWTLAYDIAIVIPTTEIIYNQFVGPACIPNRLLTDELYGQVVKAMGWGDYDPPNTNLDVPNKLRDVDLRITFPVDCYGPNLTRICAHTPGKDTCDGDSGGPLAWLDRETNRFTLVGIVSTGPANCGKSTKPSINTNVSFFKDWIIMTIKNTKSSATACYNV